MRKHALPAELEVREVAYHPDFPPVKFIAQKVPVQLVNRLPIGKRMRPAVPDFATLGPAGATNPTAAQRAMGLDAPMFAALVQKIFDLHHYAGNLSEVQATVTLVAQLLVNRPNGYRNFLAVRNRDAANNLLIGFDQAPTQQATFQLTPGQLMLLDTVVPQGDVWFLSNVAGGTAMSASFSNINFPSETAPRENIGQTIAQLLKGGPGSIAPAPTPTVHAPAPLAPAPKAGSGFYTPNPADPFAYVPGQYQTFGGDTP